eukprot:6443472-Alexandrium_andersonii.AAC.1
MDGWRPSELRAIPLLPCEWLSCMLARIEEGAAWPSQVTQINCAFVAKGKEHDVNPLAYRGLAIISIIYRTWSKLRLADVQRWVRTWQHDQCFAGVKGKGAHQAWFSTAARAERAQLGEDPYALTALDLYKAFDQCNRGVLYSLL